MTHYTLPGVDGEWTVEVFQGEDGWYWRASGPGGEVVEPSGPFLSELAAFLDAKGDESASPWKPRRRN